MSLAPLHDLIRRFEGLRLKPYMCPAAVATIGYGSTTYPNGKRVSLQDPSITQSYAEELMQRDAMIFAAAAKTLSPNLTGDKLCAIADFCYNLGTGRLQTSTLKRKINAQDWEGAKEQLMLWNKGGGKVLAGLTKRRVAECALLN